MLPQIVNRWNRLPIEWRWLNSWRHLRGGRCRWKVLHTAGGGGGATSRRRKREGNEGIWQVNHGRDIYTWQEIHLVAWDAAYANELLLPVLFLLFSSSWRSCCSRRRRRRRSSSNRIRIRRQEATVTLVLSVASIWLTLIHRLPCFRLFVFYLLGVGVILPFIEAIEAPTDQFHHWSEMDSINRGDGRR